jgi:hypothetical protein
VTGKKALNEEFLHRLRQGVKFRRDRHGFNVAGLDIRTVTTFDAAFNRGGITASQPNTRKRMNSFHQQHKNKDRQCKVVVILVSIHRIKIEALQLGRGEFRLANRAPKYATFVSRHLHRITVYKGY